MKTFLPATMLLTLLITSCDVSTNDDECILTRNEFVTTVTAPATAVINQTTNIEVKFQAGNGCGQFNRFVESGSSTSKTIGIEAIYNGCVCTTDLPIRTVNYPFTPTAAGTYTFNFRSSPTDFITVEITVN